MEIANVFRADDTNVGDWHCAPFRYFDLGRTCLDILDFDPAKDSADAAAKAIAGRHVVLGGGGLIANTFHQKVAHLAEQRPRLLSLVAWGIGESEHVDRSGGLVPPYPGALPRHMDAFHLIGMRDTGGILGSQVEWAPCVSCMAPEFDQNRTITREAVIYEHKRIPLPMDGLDRMSNEGRSLESKVAFLGSAELVITNSYHGVYWATLLGRRVLAVPNMSKMYRFRHSPVICEAESWQRYAPLAVAYPEALDECRLATKAFHNKVLELHARSVRR
jgi:hypothetical protein